MYIIKLIRISTLKQLLGGINYEELFQDKKEHLERVNNLDEEHHKP